MRSYALIFLFLFLFQEGSPQNNDRQFIRLATKDGLSPSWVRCIHQDDMGYMWFGTADGLNRYDGVEFKIYLTDSENEFSIGDKYINHISKKVKVNYGFVRMEEYIFIIRDLTFSIHSHTLIIYVLHMYWKIQNRISGLEHIKAFINLIRPIAV